MSDNLLRNLLVRYGPLAAWIAVIFFLSSERGSMSETSLFIRPLLEFLFPHASPETLAYYHGHIRKFAHFAEYFVLGVLAVRAFELPRRQRVSVSVALVAAVASLDEFNQSFEASRTSSIADVILDIVGGTCGALAASAFKLISIRNKRP